MFLLYLVYFLIPGIISLIIIKQIELRLAWDKKNNFEVKEEKLTTSEANMYQFMYADDAAYHSEKLDKAMGVKYDAKLKTDKYGNTYFGSTTKFEWNNYFGSLIAVLFLSFIIIVCIFNIIKSIKYKEYVNAIFFLFVSLPFIGILIHFIKELIEGIKEKRKIKKEVKEKKNLFLLEIFYLLVLFYLFWDL